MSPYPAKPNKTIPSWLFCLAIFCIGFCAYANSLNGGFKWDDHNLVEENYSIRTWHDTFQIFTKPLKDFPTYYRPLQALSYKFDYLLWKNHPAGYHLGNLLLHLTNALLFYFFLCLALKNRPWAFAGGLLFSCHPMLSEPVNYISSRSDLLVGTFALLTMIFALLAQSKRKKYYFVVAMVSFAVSLLSKESALVIPFLLLTWKWTTDKNLKQTIPYFLIALLYLFLRQQIILPQTPCHFTPSLLLSAPKAFTKYLMTLIYPWPLTKTWSIPPVSSLFQKDFLIPLSAVLIFGFVAKAVYSRSRLAFFGVAWFLITLSPFILVFYLFQGLENFPFSYAWLYLPSMGLFFALSSWGALTDDVSRKTIRLKTILIPVIAVLCFITIKANGQWTAPEIDFYQNILQENRYPTSMRVFSNMGRLYSKQGKYAEALEVLGQALKNNPRETGAINSVGFIYLEQNKLEEAAPYFQEAIRIDPNDSVAHYNLGLIELKRGNRQGATEEFEKAVQGNPYNLDAHYNLAFLYVKAKEETKALKEISFVLQFEPDAFKTTTAPKNSANSY